MAVKQVKSVAAGGSGSKPCGTPFSALLAGGAQAILPATLNVTFDDNSTAALPINWLFGSYDPWDNIARVVVIKGQIVLQRPGTDELRNDAGVEASFSLTLTVKNGKLDPRVGTEDCFLNKPGEPTAN